MKVTRHSGTCADEALTDTPDLAAEEACYRLYPQRWWVMGIFSVLACLQSAVWILYGPISDEVKELMGWSSFMVDLQAGRSSRFMALCLPLPPPPSHHHHHHTYSIQWEARAICRVSCMSPGSNDHGWWFALHVTAVILPRLLPDAT